jgi:hypothetical protein
MTKSTSSKSLSARIAERATRQKTSVSAQNRAAFLVLREDIKQALDDGWSCKTIWETLLEEEKITCSYPTFNGYVTKLIVSSVAPKVAPKAEIKNVIDGLKASEITQSQASKEADLPQKIEEKNSHQSLLQGLPGFVSHSISNKETLI